MTGPVMLEEGELGELTMSYACGGVASGVVSTNIELVQGYKALQNEF